MTCCNRNKNLIPILYTYSDKQGRARFGVDKFICSCCMSNICVDDSLDRYADRFKDIEDYARSILWKYSL